MATPSPRRRRRWPYAVAVGLLGAATLAITVLGMTNPWRYTALLPLDRPAVATVALVTGTVLVGIALVLGVARLAPRAVVGWTLTLAALVALCIGVPWLALDRAFGIPLSRPQQMAVSPDGSFEVVKSTFDIAGRERMLLFVRSRAGLLSRESPTPIAECDHDPFGDEIPPESVRFTSRTTVAVPVRGESTVVVTFDEQTLRPSRTVQICR